jgi:mannosyltransferase
MALVIAVAVSARAFNLADRVVWFDEAISLLVARAPSVGAAFVAARDEGHGPLFNLVLHCTTRAQPGESGARWLSVLLGAATVGVVWAIGERLAGPIVGIVSALILALCPLHVWYS